MSATTERNVIAEDFVETKMTKGEVIDFLLYELIEDQKAIQEAAEREVVLAKKNFDYNCVAGLLDRGRVVVEQERHFRGQDENTIRIEVTVDVKLNSKKITQDLRDRLNRLKAAKEAENQASSQLYKMTNDKQRMKMSIIRSFLDSTAHGQKFLSHLDQMRIKLRKMLPSKQI